MLGILCNITSWMQVHKNRSESYVLLSLRKNRNEKDGKPGKPIKTGKGKQKNWPKESKPKKRECCASSGLELTYVYNLKVLV